MALVVLGTILMAACGGNDEVILADFDEAEPAETVTEADARREEPVYRCTEQELIEALKRRKPATVKACLDSGTRPDAVDEENHPAIYLAADKGDAESVAALLEAGARADQMEDPASVTPLFAAAYGGHLEVVDLLLDHGADASFHTPYDSPLLIACRKKHTGVALRLIDAGADVSFTDPTSGESPVMRAAMSGNRVLLERLIASGADVTTHGGKILRLSARRPEIYDILVAAGATPDD